MKKSRIHVVPRHTLLSSFIVEYTFDWTQYLLMKRLDGTRVTEALLCLSDGILVNAQ